MSHEKGAKPKFLSGWKEIAEYLGKGVRTVQRYEREMGLPIHRPTGKSAASVTAIATELDNWVGTPHVHAPSLARRRALKSQTNILRANFLQIDSEIALTFSNLSSTASDPAKKRRTAEVARKAYDAILRLSEETYLNDTDKNKLQANLRRLKRELQDLGQTF